MVIKNRDGEDMGTCHAQAKEEPPRKKNTYYPQKKRPKNTYGSCTTQSFSGDEIR